MKRVSFFAIITMLSVDQGSVAFTVHPAVQVELQKCLTHGMLLAEDIQQNMQDAREIREAGKNAFYARQLASNAEQAALAEKEKARFFAALKKQQTKVPKPELTENFAKSVTQVILTVIGTLPASTVQKPDTLLINGIPVNPLFLKS